MEIFAVDLCGDDRRRVVGVGIQHGRDAMIRQFQTAPDLGVKQAASNVIATRGERLTLTRTRFSRIDDAPDAFRVDLLHIIETNDDEQIMAIVSFDVDDFEAAIAELDARYLAGEAAAHAHTWSVIIRGQALLNRRELPPSTTDLVSIDHRRGSGFAPGELVDYIQAGFDLNQDIRTYYEVVHRLSDLGAVCTHAGHGISREGFDAEWRGIDLVTVDGDRVNRCEIFEESDLDTALAAFDQLSSPAPRLENTASRMADRVMAHFSAREWDAAAEMVADDFSSDDRRRTVNAGMLFGRDAAMKDAHANAYVGAKEISSAVVATRGERLVLRRAHYSSSAERPDAFYVDALSVYEIDGAGRLAATVVFDPDQMGAALEELETRYLAGEGAANAHTWSVIARAFASLNRGDILTTTPDFVDTDHRKLAIASGDLIAYLGAGLAEAAHTSLYVEAVHRLTDIGAVVTHTAKRNSDDFAAEWRMTDILTVEGDLINRCELFDEADLDAALARFEELRPQPRPLENAASRASGRYFAYFAARDWAAIAENLTDDSFVEDRNYMVNAGLWGGRDTVIANLRAQRRLGPT